MQHARIVAAFKELDPCEDITYSIGSDDDFICFAWTTVEGTTKGHFEKRFLLKATVNSETGHFIQTFGEYQCSWLDSPHKMALSAVDDAMDWCTTNNVRHNKSSSNADPYHLVRDVWHHCKKQELDDIGEQIPWKVTQRQIRMGGKQINKACGLSP